MCSRLLRVLEEAEGISTQQNGFRAQSMQELTYQRRQLQVKYYHHVLDKHLKDVVWAYDTSVRLIKDLSVSHGLELGEHKTEVVLVSCSKLKEILRFRLGQPVIKWDSI